jgi:hypothetical protein
LQLIEPANESAHAVLTYWQAHRHEDLPRDAWNSETGQVNEVVRPLKGHTPEMYPSGPKWPTAFYSKDPDHPKYTGRRRGE